MKPGLTQTALNLAVKAPDGPRKLRAIRKEAEKWLDDTLERAKEFEGLIERIGIALGEVQA